MGRSILVLLLCINAIPVASAHLMVAQQGTLNVVDGGAFMVISLPISAFTSVDDDGDGKLSREEFARHQADLRAAVMQGMQLRDSDWRPTATRPDAHARIQRRSASAAWQASTWALKPGNYW